jgi:anti-sigma B factor antagonist
MRRMPGEAFSISRRSGSTDNVQILAPRGPISFTTAPEFREAMEATTAKGVIIDLTEVPSIDSVAVGVLVRAFVTCQKTDRRLALVGLAHRVRNVLHLTGIDPLFETFPTVADAERALA